MESKENIEKVFQLFVFDGNNSGIIKLVKGIKRRKRHKVSEIAHIIRWKSGGESQKPTEKNIRNENTGFIASILLQYAIIPYIKKKKREVFRPLFFLLILILILILIIRLHYFFLPIKFGDIKMQKNEFCIGKLVNIPMKWHWT